MSQKAKILSHLKRFGSITQKEAIGLYQCYRLSARILELTEAGNEIQAEMNRCGKNGRYARYFLRATI